MALVVKRWMGAIPVRADSGLRRLDPLHQGQGARPSERVTGRAGSASALRASYQTACGAASGISDPTSHLRLFKSYYNLCRKHGSLKGKTPAQSAGLTGHQWTLRELLTFNAAIISKIT